MYGAQTFRITQIFEKKFENDVEMYGAQTFSKRAAWEVEFENDVEMYGAQTLFSPGQKENRLRMM